MVGNRKGLYPYLVVYTFFILLLGLVVCTSHTQADERFSDFLPFGKQWVDEDSKARLPLPIGINFNFFFQEQDLDLDKISVSSSTASTDPAILGLISMLPALAFSTSSIESEVETYTLRIDAWILPFLNIYVLLGYADGKSTIEVSSVSHPLMPAAFLILQLQAAGIQVPFDFEMDYDGKVYGGGMTLAGGYKDFFCTLAMNYTYTDLDFSDSTIETFTFTPRVGVSGNLGTLEGKIWMGAMYQDTTHEIEGETIFGPIQVAFDLEQSAEDPWNYVIGGQWDISKAWNILLEIGMGERESLYASGAFRW